jgi:Dimerisation domain
MFTFAKSAFISPSSFRARRQTTNPTAEAAVISAASILLLLSCIKSSTHKERRRRIGAAVWSLNLGSHFCSMKVRVVLLVSSCASAAAFISPKCPLQSQLQSRIAVASAQHKVGLVTRHDRTAAARSTSMVLLQPLKYVVTFTSGIAVSTWVNRRVQRRRERQAVALQKQGGPASPKLFLDTANAHVATATLKAACELDVFSELAAITRRGEQPTAARAAMICKCSDRGMRILLDALVARGFLTKSTASKPAYTYWLTPSSAKYLDKASPSYIADAMGWLASDALSKPIWEGLTNAVRQGGADTASPPIASSEGKDLRWVRFAGSMGGKSGPIGKPLQLHQI